MSSVIAHGNDSLFLLLSAVLPLRMNLQFSGYFLIIHYNMKYIEYYDTGWFYYEQ